jgi:hypothetical protein
MLCRRKGKFILAGSDVTVKTLYVMVIIHWSVCVDVGENSCLRKSGGGRGITFVIFVALLCVNCTDLKQRNYENLCNLLHPEK